MIRGSARALRLAVLAVAVSGGLAVAGCIGGSATSVPSGAINAAPSLQALPTAGGTLNVPPAANGQTAAISVGAGAPAGIFVTSSSSTTAPGSAPAPTYLRRLDSLAGAVPFFYVTFSVSAPVSASYLTAESVELMAAQPASGIYYVEFDDSGVKLGTSGPATASNGRVTISNLGGDNAPTLLPGHVYLLQFYYLPAGSTSAP